MKKFYLLLAIMPLLTIAQEKEKEKKDFGIKFSGFAKTDAFYDTRQTVNLREGHFLLYPDNILLDANKKDINAKANFNMLSIKTSLKVAVTGPVAFVAKKSGVIEPIFSEMQAMKTDSGYVMRL